MNSAKLNWFHTSESFIYAKSVLMMMMMTMTPSLHISSSFQLLKIYVVFLVKIRRKRFDMKGLNSSQVLYSFSYFLDLHSFTLSSAFMVHFMYGRYIIMDIQKFKLG